MIEFKLLVCIICRMSQQQGHTKEKSFSERIYCKQISTKVAFIISLDSRITKKVFKVYMSKPCSMK